MSYRSVWCMGFAWMVVSGCLQGGPTEFEDPDAGPQDPPPVDGGPPNVDSNGATLQGCDGSLKVPLGAVDRPIRVDLTSLSPVQVWLPDPSDWFAAAPCSVTPHDTVFGETATVEVKFDRRLPRGGVVKDEDLRVARLESFEDKTWEVIADVLEVDDDVIRFSTDRLGIFGVVRPKQVGLDSLQSTPTFAAVLSNFETSAIALLDEKGKVLKNAWVDSGTVLPILNGTISGDVYLPSEQPANQFALIDRFGVDVVSRFTVPGGELVGQVRTQPADPDGTIAFSMNPYDVAFVDGESAWVSRYSPGPPADLGGSDPMKRGNDLLEINPRTMLRTGRTIDMSPFNASVVLPDESVESVPARPSHMVQVEDFLVVSLNRQGAVFDVAGTGALAIVDLESLDVTLHELPGFNNCVEIARSPDEKGLLFVSCVGFAVPFGDEAQVRASGGIAVVRIDSVTGAATNEPGLHLAAHPSMPLIRSTPVGLSSTELVAVATGDFIAGTGDRLYYVDLDSSEVSLIAESSAFGLGLPAFDPDEGLLVLPDAEYNSPRIRRFQWKGGDTFNELETEDTVLEPRRIYWLGR